VRTLSWKTYLTASAAITTGTATVLAAMTGTPTGLVMAGAAAACAVCAKLGRGALNYSPALNYLDNRTREQAVRLFPLAPAAHAAWVAGAMLIDAPAQWAAALVALGAAEYGVARGLEYKAKIIPKPRDAAVAAVDPQSQSTATSSGKLVHTDPQQPITVMQRVLGLAGLGHVHVTGWEWIGPRNEILGITFSVKLPPNAGKRSGGESPKLSMVNAEAIAIAFGEITGTEIGSSWVQITKLPAAGAYTITVTSSDTMKRLYPYQIDARRVSIADPALVGYGIDGLPHYERVNQHWLHTGGTRFGKTGLVQVLRTHTLRAAHEAVLWVGGTEKLYDSVGPWVDPFIGTGKRPPIDWVAKGPQDTLNMITAAFILGRWRQSVPHHRRGGFKTVVVEIDEASFFLMLERLVIEYEGESLTPSRMVENIIKGIGSADVWIHLVSQRGTNDQFGESGGSITANIQVRTAFRTSDGDEIGRAFGDWKLPMPANAGEYYIQGTDSDVRRLRAPYIQETDPKKPRLHNGANLNDVALSLADMWQGLDRESAWALGEVYANRPQTAEDLFRYLTGMDPDLEFGPSVTGSVVHGGDSADVLCRPVPTDSAEPGSEPRSTPTPSPLDSASANLIPTAELLRSSEQIAQERATALIDRLLDAGDTDALTRLAACESLADLDRFEAELTDVTTPLLTAPVARVGMPAIEPVPAESTAANSVMAGRVAPVMPAVTLVEDRPSRTDRIAQIVDDAGPVEITRAEIIAALIEDGDEATASSFEQQVTNALRQLVQRRIVVRADRGYLSARHHRADQDTSERNPQ
jgi:hypothetical protein